MKKVVSLILVALLLLLQIPTVAVQAAGNTAEYSASLSVKEGTPGTEVTVAVNLTMDAATKVSGMELTVEFEDRYFNYVAGSAKAGTALLDAATIHYVGGGRIRFVWTNTDGVVLPAKTTIFEMSLVVADGAEPASTQISAQMDRLYQCNMIEGNDGEEVQMVAIPCTAKTLPIFSINGADAQIENVENLISAIGQVTHDAACLSRINAAADAYSKLPLSKQAQVSNYQVLLAAQEMYYKLQYNGALPPETQAIVDAFMLKYGDLINMTLKDAAELEDAEAVAVAERITAALEEYAELESPHAQAELVAEKTMLRRLQKLVLAEYEDALHRAQYEDEAKKQFERYKNNHDHVFNVLTEDNVLVTDKANVDSANGTYIAYKNMVNTGIYFEELMVEAGYDTHLTKLLEKIAAMTPPPTTPLTTPEIIAKNYKDSFAGILLLEPEDLLYEDLADVTLAYGMLSIFDDATLALLEEEQAIMEVLYDAVLKLEPSEPSEPSEPTQPSQPSEPSQPTQPSQPSEPSQPSQPSAPTEPAVNKAEQEAQQWKDYFSDVLVLTPQIMSINDVLDVKLANEMLSRLSDEAKALLSAEQTKIGVLYAKAVELEKAQAADKPDVKPEELTAQQWINRFTPVLNLKPEELTYDDVLDVKLAKLALELMSDEAKALLVDEVKMIDALYEKANTLEPEKEIITETIEKIIEVEKLVEKDVRVEVLKRNIGIIIWILLALAVVSAVTYVIVRIYFNKKNLKGGNK